MCVNACSTCLVSFTSLTDKLVNLLLVSLSTYAHDLCIPWKVMTVILLCSSPQVRDVCAIAADGNEGQN